ncbi:MAG: phage tail tube protein, partial [Clostridia bacterium]|nr:phage tail tube protein [Clostridia bacterium]
MAYMEGKNVLSGREGTAFITVDGQVKEIAYLKNIEASVELNKVEVQTLGRRVTQHKINGWSGTGSMNV